MLSSWAVTSGFPVTGDMHVEMQMFVMPCEGLWEVNSFLQKLPDAVKNAMDAPEHFTF